MLEQTDIDFYPRPLRGGRRGIRLGYKATVKFLSTPSARRATSIVEFCPLCEIFLSTPSARRETLTNRVSKECGVISIHALC